MLSIRSSITYFVFSQFNFDRFIINSFIESNRLLFSVFSIITFIAFPFSSVEISTLDIFINFKKLIIFIFNLKNLFLLTF